MSWLALPLLAGPEIAVASQSYTAQIIVEAILAHAGYSQIDLK